MTTTAESALRALWSDLADERPQERCRRLLSALRFEAVTEPELSGEIGALRAHWARIWEELTDSEVPIAFLRTVLNDEADLCLCERVWEVAASDSLTVFVTANQALIEELQSQYCHTGRT